jgi:hypothetical protein
MCDRCSSKGSLNLPLRLSAPRCWQKRLHRANGDVSFSAGRRGGGSASSDDAEGEQCGTAALHEVSDLMPVEAVGVDLGQRLGDPESLEL